MYNYIFWGVMIALIVFLFASIFFWKGKRKEYALYQPNGDVLHLYRRSQSFWFDWPGQMVYENEKGKRIIIGTHWYLRIQELEEGEWVKIAEAQQKKEPEKE